MWNDCKDAKDFFSRFAVDLHFEPTMCLNTAWFLLELTVNLKPISDQPLLLDCWLNQLCD